MTSPSLPVPTSSRDELRMLRRILLAVVVFAGLLIAVAGHASVESSAAVPAPGSGLAGVSQPAPVPALHAR